MEEMIVVVKADLLVASLVGERLRDIRPLRGAMIQTHSDRWEVLGIAVQSLGLDYIEDVVDFLYEEFPDLKIEVFTEEVER